MGIQGDTGGGWTLSAGGSVVARGPDARRELEEKIAAIPYWYHKIDLGGGIVTPGWAPLVPEAYQVPERMDGELVLDVGAWDGYWTFEAFNRGASHVTAIDDFSDDCGELVQGKHDWASFDLCAEALAFQAGAPWTPSHWFRTFTRGDVSLERQTFSIEHEDLGDRGEWADYQCDRVFCFGVLYHLRNPVLALQNCFDALKIGGTIHVETAIIDNIQSPYTKSLPPENACYAEFYPTNEFGKNQSNWWVPTLKCAASWLHAVGFRDIEAWKLTDSPKSLAECRGFLKAVKQ